MAEEREAEYHSKDFEWETLRDEVENDSSLQYHLAPCLPSDASLTFSSDAWRSFHRRHSTGKFFKERRYLLKEFPELVGCDDSAKVLEVGCGNGSTVLPILRVKQSIEVYACDCSAEVLEIAKKMIAAANLASVEHRFHPFLLDVSVNEFPNWLFCDLCQENSVTKPTDFSSAGQCCVGGVDFLTLIFTLSAVPFDKMPFLIKKCLSVLKPGCLLLFRDYGLYDMTMLRFPPGQRVGFRKYMRSDGTLSYFFSLDVIRDLFCGAGFVELELDYCCVRSVNHRHGKQMKRIWVHGKFQKPICSIT